MKMTSSSLRIVHACNFHYDKHGDKYDIMDAKLQHGLIENGHYVYAFPIHDIARQSTWRNSKRAGAKKANSALIETCQKIHPDILLLGHSKSITRETLETIRVQHPQIKIAQWFCDWFYSEHRYTFEFIYDRLDLLDVFFATTGGTHLESFNQKGCRASFIPNPVHPAIERYRAFESDIFQYDLVFMGTDRKDPERSETLREIESQLGGKYRIGIFGSLGRPPVFGHAKDLILSKSKAALNLTRLPEPMQWYSSDRIASLMGNGLLTCTRAEASLHELYGEESMLYYTSTDDLMEQLDRSLSDDTWKTTAEAGWRINHKKFNAKRVTAQLIDFTLDPKCQPLSNFSNEQ